MGKWYGKFNNEWSEINSRKVESLSMNGIEIKSEIEILKEALEYYADRKNWRYSGNDQFNNTIHHSDASYIMTGKQRDKIGGKRARQVLGLEEKE